MAGPGGRQVDDREKAVTPHEPCVAVVECDLPVHVGGATRAEDAGAVDRVQRRRRKPPSAEPPRLRWPTERAQAVRASVAATSGKQLRLDGGRSVEPQRPRACGCVERHSARDAPRAAQEAQAAECRAAATAVANRAGASSARERRRHERQAAAS